MLTSRHALVVFFVVALCACAAIAWPGSAPREEAAQDRYDFRNTGAYRALSDDDRNKLEQVHRDFVLLWGALEMYCDVYAEPPESLEKLTPLILRELPIDPFTAADAKDRNYKLRKGAPGNRAWVISSTGLSSFPYLAERGNVGLYICKGTWISGNNPIMTDE